MYEIKSDGELVGYADDIIYNKLHTNGCYVLCSRAEAEGICVKMPKKYANAETGETETHITSTVYRLTDNGLLGTEPKCEIKLVSGAQVISDKDNEIENILTELEKEAGT